MDKRIELLEERTINFLEKTKKEKFETVFFCEKSAEESRFFAFLSQKADRKTEKKVAETKKIP